MIRHHRLLAITAFAATLSGCAAGAVPRPAAVPPKAPPPTVVKPVQHNALIGSSTDAVGRMFGKPRLDVTEGAGRKLQFAGTSCILDIYFYSARAGAEPVATHVDARTVDGRNAEVEGCANSLRR